MATKKKQTKKSNNSVMIGTIVPGLHADALRLLAQKEDRSVSKIVKKLVEDSPSFQAALKEVQAA